MNKFLDANYWMFRVVIPGIYCCVIVLFFFRIYEIKFIFQYLVGLKALTLISGCGIGLGLLFHYVIDYPRQKKRFKEIEAQYGPIDYLLRICVKCEKPCNIQKSYSKMSYVYFSILNDDVPAGTRSVVYYFSSVYLLFTQVAFISAVIAAINSIFFTWTIFSQGKAPFFLSILFSSLLAVVSIVLTRKDSAPERYLIRMFESQTEWLKRNKSIINERLCDTYRPRITS